MISDKIINNFFGLRGLKVNGKVSLISVSQHKKDTNPILVGITARPSALVSPFYRFNFYHIGSQIC